MINISYVSEFKGKNKFRNAERRQFAEDSVNCDYI